MIDGWEREKLGSVCDFVRGPFGGSLKKSCFVSEGYAVYEQQHAIYNQFEKIRYFVDEAKFNEMSRFELRAGDLIMSCSGTMGKVAIVPEGIPQGIINQALLKLTVNKKLDVTFLQLWMQSPNFQMQLIKHSKGAAIKNVASVKVLKEIELDLPSLPEQKRIVTILDEAFAGISQAVTNAEKNLANARELFDSYLNNIFTQKGEGWIDKKLEDVCETTQGVQIPKSKQVASLVTGLRRYLYISDFNHDKNLKFVEDFYPKKMVTTHDLVVVNTGASAGKIHRGIDGVLSNNLFKVSFDNNQIDDDFLYYFVTSETFKEHQKKIVKGTANPHMGHKNFGSTPFSVPPIGHQQSIVKRLNSLNRECVHFENIYQKKLTALAELKQSILQKAFTGELAIEADLKQANG